MYNKFIWVCFLFFFCFFAFFLSRYFLVHPDFLFIWNGTQLFGYGKSLGQRKYRIHLQQLWSQMLEYVLAIRQQCSNVHHHYNDNHYSSSQLYQVRFKRHQKLIVFFRKKNVCMHKTIFLFFLSNDHIIDLCLFEFLYLLFYAWIFFFDSTFFCRYYFDDFLNESSVHIYHTNSLKKKKRL